MAIDKADTLAFVNKRLLESLADIDDEIKATLADLSKYNLLTATPVEVAGVSGDVSIDYPTLFKRLISITPNDGSVDRRPMEPLAGGYVEYKRLLAFAQANFSLGQMFYVEHNKKFFIYPTLSASFTFTIEYYQHHANDADEITFGDEYINAINYGACYHTALFRKKTSYIAQWLPIYQAERATMIAMNPPQPKIVRR